MGFAQQVRNGIVDWLFNSASITDGIAVNNNPNTAIYVDPKKSLRLSAVYSCVRVISESLASLPKSVHRYNGEYDVPVRDHNLYRIIAVEPKDYMTSYDYHQAFFALALLWGNAYARIERDNNMNVTALHLLHSAHVHPIITEDDALRYVEYRDGDYKIHRPEDIFHFKMMNYDGITGLSPIEEHKKTVGSALAANDYINDFYRNGAKLQGILSTDQKLDNNQRNNIESSWKSRYGGPSAEYHTPVLEGGLKYQAMSIPPEDAQYIETRKFNVEDIARIYGVPPHKIGIMDKATYNNVEQQNIEFVQDTLRFHIERYENEAKLKLFRENEINTHSIVFNVEGLLRGDFKTRTEGYAKLFGIGVLSPNNIRRLEKMAPREDGDSYYTPLNFAKDGRAQESTTE